MAMELVHEGVWRRITSLARRQLSFIAVAYCSKGARKLLPVAKGSVLVVDLSERAVKAGQTDPREIKKFIRAGIEVHSVENLHAKVFVLGRVAMVGSANVSSQSAHRLQEAVVQGSAPAFVAECREYVRSLRGEVVESEHADAMAKLYRPPKFAPGSWRRTSKGTRTGRATTMPAHAPLWVAQLSRIHWDEEETAQARLRRPHARRKIDKRRDTLEEFSWPGSPLYESLKERDLVLQITKESNGVEYVSQAAHVVLIRRYRAGGKRRYRRMIVFLAVPRGSRRRRKARLLRVLGTEGKALRKLASARQIRDEYTVHAILSQWPQRISAARMAHSRR